MEGLFFDTVEVESADESSYDEDFTYMDFSYIEDKTRRLVKKTRSLKKEKRYTI
jgi:hypothetical protein